MSNKLEEAYRLAFGQNYINIASGINTNLSLEKFFDLLQESTSKNAPPSSKVTKPQNVIFDNPLVKQIKSQVKHESNKSMYEQFLQAYLSPFNSDVDNRLGKVVFNKALKEPNLFTDEGGRIYTRSTFAIDYYARTRPNGYKQRFTFSQLFFPPYAYNGRVDATPNMPWNPNANPEIQSKHFNLRNYKIDRDLFTYREPAFKPVNDNIEFVQWLFEGLTGIVSTYMTEWDLSLYIQEGIIKKAVPGEDQPCIHLLYRMKSDNPLGYKDDRALAFGAINAATSKWGLNKIWDVSSYPLSKYWVQRFDNPTEFPDKTNGMTNGDPPNFSGMLTLYELFNQIKAIDKWDAFAAGWKDFSMPYYKCLYEDGSDGLTDLDLAYFSQDEISSSTLSGSGGQAKPDRRPELKDSKCIRCLSCIASCPKGLFIPIYVSGALIKIQHNRDSCNECGKCVEACSKILGKNVALETPETRRYNVVGEGGGQVDKAQDYVNGQEWLGASEKQDKTIMPLGTPVRNPVFYGGPHGNDFSPKSPQSIFDVNSVFMRNVPRLNYCDFASKNGWDYTQNCNKYYYHPRLIKDEISKTEWDSLRIWKQTGNRLFTPFATKETGKDWADDGNPNSLKGAIQRVGNSDMSPLQSFHYLKQGMPEIRPYLVAYKYEADVEVQVTSGWDRFWWGFSSIFSWWRTSNKPAYSMVYNNINNSIERQDYRYYGPVYYKRNQTWFSWWFNYRTTAYQRAKQYRYAYDIAYKYMHHAEPDVAWEIKPFRIARYGPSTQYQVLLWIQHILSITIGNWVHLRPVVPPLLRAYGIDYRLCFKGAANVRTVRDDVEGSYTFYSWPGTESKVAEKMVKNHRGLWSANNLLFFGDGRNPDFVFRAPVSMGEIKKVYTRYHSHRCHRCHYHREISWFEFIRVQLDATSFEATSLRAEVEDNWNRDVFSENEASRVPKKTRNSILEYFTGQSTLSGQGLLMSWPGFEPEITIPTGNTTGNYCAINTSLQNVPLKNITLPRYVISSYNTGAQYSEGGHTYYTNSNALENYAASGSLPSRITQTMFKCLTSATFYKEKEGAPTPVSIVWPVRILALQLEHQLEFYRMYKAFVTRAVSLQGIRDIIIKGIDPKTTRANDGSKAYKADDPDYNYWYRKAYDFFMKNEGDIVQECLTSLDERIEQLQAIHDVFIPYINKPVLEWTYNELKTCFIQMKSAEGIVLEKDPSIDLLWNYLNVLYEYRKFFISKRFNKANGTYYVLRHLEILTIAAAELASLIEDPTSLDSPPEGNMYEVVCVDIQNSLIKKAKALMDQISPLPNDRVTAVYTMVQYPKGVTTPVEADEWERKNGWEPGKEHLLIKTTLIPGSEGYNPEHQWAIKPKNGHYILKSTEWETEENTKKKVQVFRSQGKQEEAEEMALKLKGVDTSIIYNIVWEDKPDKTPIIRGNLIGVDPELKKEYEQTIDAENQNVYDELCYAKQTVDYWKISLSKANVSYPKLTGFKTNVRIETYQEEEAIAPGVLAALGTHSGKLYPVTENQAVIFPGIEALPEVQEVAQNMLNNGL